MQLLYKSLTHDTSTITIYYNKKLKLNLEIKINFLFYRIIPL